jgi:F-type H+-transporting ATPase subunit epsilon
MQGRLRLSGGRAKPQAADGGYTVRTMAKTFQCTIVTPTKAVLDDEVTYASFPAWDGQQGVMAGESPLLSRLGIGSLRLDFPEGGSRWFLVEGGFAQVQDNRLTILTDNATAAESISMPEADAEVAAANARVHEHAPDREAVERDQARAMAKKRLAEQVAARGHAM